MRLQFFLLVFLALFLFSAVGAFAQTDAEADDCYQRFDQVSLLRGQGNIQASLQILEGIILEYTDSEEVIRRAFNELVYTLSFAQREEDAKAKAREALLRYPDLEVDPATAPIWLNPIYDELRAEMFGSLTIAEPESCRVFLNGDHVGNTPLKIDYLEARVYDLEMFKSGYHAYEDTLQINPSGIHEFSFSMDRDRTRGWWLKRIGAVAAAAVLVAVITDEDAPVEPAPLSGEPPLTPW